MRLREMHDDFSSETVHHDRYKQTIKKQRQFYRNFVKSSLIAYKHAYIVAYIGRYLISVPDTYTWAMSMHIRSAEINRVR